MSEVDWAGCERDVLAAADELSGAGRHVLGVGAGDLGPILARIIAALRDLADEIAVGARRVNDE